MTRQAAVLGRPIGHSLSPVLHRAAYAALGLDWTYSAIDCGVDDLPRVLAEARAARPPFAGLSVTMPLKEALGPLLDAVTSDAAALEAVNTVVYDDDGRSTGHNTDVTGVLRALDEAGVTGAVRRPVVLGAGGTARAVVAAFAARGCTAVDVVLRDPARGVAAARAGERLGVAVTLVPWADVRPAVAAADVVVNTTPAGAADGLAAEGWPPGVPLVDVLYHPWPTRLGEAASDAGAAVVGGLTVLVGQAAAQVALMTGRPAPYDDMRRAGEAALAERAIQPNG